MVSWPPKINFLTGNRMVFSSFNFPRKKGKERNPYLVHQTLSRRKRRRRRKNDWLEGSKVDIHQVGGVKRRPAGGGTTWSRRDRQSARRRPYKWWIHFDSWTDPNSVHRSRSFAKSGHPCRYGVSIPFQSTRTEQYPPPAFPSSQNANILMAVEWDSTSSYKNGGLPPTDSLVPLAFAGWIIASAVHHTLAHAREG